MDRYKKYTRNDFIRDDDFIRWVKAPDTEGTLFWENIKKEFPFQERNMDHAAQIIRGLSSYYPEVPEIEIETARQAIFQRYNESQAPPKGRNLFFFISAAASILITIGIALWYFTPNHTESIQSNVRLGRVATSFENDTQRYRAIRLPDSSTVTLAPGSQIRYDMENQNSRQVFLEGVAFFNVTKNPKSPFFVYCNGLITKVIGTKFKITSTQNHDGVKVEVSSGKVKVYREEENQLEAEGKGLILTPNQSAVYSKKDLHITRSVVQQPRVLVSAQQLKSYSYIDTPISQIFDGLEEIYGIKVVYDKEKFKDCKLNMVLSDESLFQKLELIGKVVEAQYNVIDGQVIIIGDGCSE